MFSPQNSLSNLILLPVSQYFGSSLILVYFDRSFYVSETRRGLLLSKFKLIASSSILTWLDLAQERPGSIKVIAILTIILEQSCGNWRRESLIEDSNISYFIWTILRGILTLQLSRENLESNPTSNDLEKLSLYWSLSLLPTCHIFSLLYQSPCFFIYFKEIQNKIFTLMVQYGSAWNQSYSNLSKQNFLKSFQSSQSG